MKQANRQLPQDESVRIPDAVKRNAARAEELLRASTGQPEPGADQGGQPPAAGAEPPPEPPPEPPVAPAQPPAGDWENRYNSMRGRFEKADKANREMSQRISHLENVLATMSTAAAPQPQPRNGATPPAAPADVRFKITPEEEEQYGSEFLDVVGRKAGEIAAAQTQELRAEIENLKGQLGQVGSHLVRTAHEEMEATLDRDIPDWVKINEHPDFIRWLRLPDTYSGAIRHNLLKAAWDRADTARVKAFFQGFLDEEAAVAPARGQEPPPAAPGNGTPPGSKPDLIEFAAPGRAKPAGGPPPGDEKPIISRAQVSQFYSLVQRGHYLGNEAEKNRLEKMIFDAQAEGRIQ